MADQPLILIHDATGDEYVFTDRSTYLSTLYTGGYSEKFGEDESPRTPAAAPAPAAPRPAPAQPVRPAGES